MMSEGLEWSKWEQRQTDAYAAGRYEEESIDPPSYIFSLKHWIIKPAVTVNEIK